MTTHTIWNSQYPAEVASGGTGLATITDHAVMVGSGVAAVTPIAMNTNGMLLIGSNGADPVAALPTSSSLTITGGAGTLTINTNASLQTDTGFASWGGAGAYFDDTTLGDFTVLRPGTGYINNVLVSWAAPQTVSGLTAGNTYWIYIDSTGTLQKTNTYADSTFTNNIPLFECLRDSTPVTNNQVTVKENHPYQFPVYPSVYLHDVVGTVIENINNGANITLNGTQKIQINGTDYLSDHGLETTIPDSGGVAVSWNKKYTTAAGKWALQNISDTFTGFYNNGGTPTALGANKFGVYTLYASKDNLNTSTPTYFSVLDTSQYNTAAAASSAISAGTTAKASNELAALELCQLGYIIYGQAANAIVQVIISKATLKQTLSTAGTNQASLVNTDTSLFDGILSAADTNVQAALNTIDDFGKNLTDHCVVVGNGNGQPLGVIGAGTTGTTLIGVTGADPTFGTAVVAGGGTGITTTTAYAPICGGTTATGAFQAATTGFSTSGYVLTSNGNAALPSFQALPAGGLTYAEETGATKTIVINYEYGANRGGGVAFTLPATAAIGTRFAITGISGNWSIAQSANQYIKFGAFNTTTGVGGSLTATDAGDCITCTCIVADLGWRVTASIGNITIV